MTSGMSCFGNFSMGEIGDSFKSSLNKFKDPHLLKFEKINAGKCAIPGFAPPTLPAFTLPPFPLFGGLPPFPLLCGLPSFPGLPALSLPGISIPLPPLPFMLPIPLPIPGFALPTLPFLPLFDLGSLSFLCGLINIKLPVLDPFAFINNAIKDLNSFINGLNSWLQFCKENAEVKNTTEVPPTVPVTQSKTFPPLSPANNTSKGKSGGMVVPKITNTGSKPTNKQVNNGPVASKDQINKALSNISLGKKRKGSDIAIALADQGIIPLEPSSINQLANKLAGYVIEDLNADNIQEALNGIPVDFIGFKSVDLQDCLPSDTLEQFIACLMRNGILAECGKQEAFNALRGVFPSTATNMAIAMNAYGVPFGDSCEVVKKISRDDIARSFYLKSTTDPLTTNKIVNILVNAGIIDQTGQNVKNAITVLTPLPDLITPDTLELALGTIDGGPALGSLKAACIACTRGITPTTLPLIDTARNQALLELTDRFSNTPFIDRFTNTSLNEFKRFFSDLPNLFPLSIYDLIPILSIKMQIDDAALQELFSLFPSSQNFNDITSLYNFLSYAAKSVSSKQEATKAIGSCEKIKEGDFDFDNLIRSIEVTLKKYSIQLPSDQVINQKMASALKIENNYGYVETVTILADKAIQTIDELGFLLLATGVVAHQPTNTISSDELVGTSTLSKPIIIKIESPTNKIVNIEQSSLNISITTVKITSAGIKTIIHDIIKDGVVVTGNTTMTLIDEFLQIFEIRIIRIKDYIEEFEAIEKINVTVNFSTAASLNSERVPQHLISISA